MSTSLVSSPTSVLLLAFRSHLPQTIAAVNNAGGAHGTDIVGNIQDKDIDTMFATNVFGLISLTQLLIKGLSATHPHRTSPYNINQPPRNAHTFTVPLQHR